MKRFVPFTILIAALAFVAGCNTNKLATGGAYAPGYYATNTDGTVSTNFTATAAPNYPLLEVDLAWITAYTAFDAASQFEENNRVALFKISPLIKHGLDQARPEAWSIYQRWAVARQAYDASPTLANMTTLQALVSQIQNVSAAAQAAVAITPKP